MRIGVTGDIHGNYSGLKRAVEQIGPVDQWLFTGDGYREVARLRADLGITVVGVAGNCDLFTEYPDEQRLQLGNYRILLTHGHLYGVKQGLTRLALVGQSEGFDLVVFGHTHRQLHELWGQVRLFNPGALAVGRTAGYGLIELDAHGIRPTLYQL
ncbi:MAG TPA: YfcE family phosphodiesterase [Bacillota bacterium]